MTEIRPQLTISLLISNRMETIPRCLDSLRPIMDAIPCELILTDTSKNPEIHKLLLEYTDLVYEFEWCNNFAKARNLGLEKANGEWFMFLDDDEWFSDSKAIIEFFQSGEYQKYHYAYYQVRNFKDVEYVYYDDCWLPRLFRIEEGSQFVRRIHEHFMPMKGLEKHILAMVYHSGYIYETLEDRRKHFERNRTLLLDMIKEEPDNIYWWLQLTQEYSYADEQQALVAYTKECLQKLAKIDNAYINNQRGTFYTGLVTACIRQKNYTESVAFANKALADKRSGKVLKAMMHLRIGEAYLFLNQIDEAKTAVLKYLYIAERIDLKSKEIMEQTKVFLVGEAFNKNSLEIAYAILICCDLKQGRMNALIEYYDKLGWSNPVVYTMERIEEYFVNAMWAMSHEPIFTQIIIDAFCKDNLRKAFRKEILSQEQAELTTFQQVVYDLAYTMQNVMDGPKENLLEYYNDLQNFVYATSQWYDFVEAEGMTEHFGNETPSYVLAAIDIADYMELESKDTISALTKLKSAVEKMPEFAKGIGQFFERYKELEEERAAQQRNEMEVLRIQVISQVKMMMENGQHEAAKQIMEQLKVMFPNDAEVFDLEKELK